MKSQIPKDKPLHTVNIQVSEQDLDDLKHVNNLVYLKWVLDAAQNHWLSLTNEKIREKYHWVVLRHEIDYYKPALLNDQLTVITWVEWHEGVRSLRKVNIYRNSQLIASTKTIWCLLDAKTMRPKRIENDISDLYV